MKTRLLTLVSVIILLNSCKTHTVSRNFSQKYVSKNSDYFPTELYLFPNSKFLYKEFMGSKEHANNEYYQKGYYKIKKDTLYLFSHSTGFNCDYLTELDKVGKELNITRGLYKDGKIHLLNKDESTFLELKKVKLRNEKEVLDCIN